MRGKRITDCVETSLRVSILLAVAVLAFSSCSANVSYSNTRDMASRRVLSFHGAINGGISWRSLRCASSASRNSFLYGAQPASIAIDL